MLAGVRAPLALLSLLGASPDFPYSYWVDQELGVADATGRPRSLIPSPGSLPFPERDPVVLLHCLRQTRVCSMVILHHPHGWFPYEMLDLNITTWSTGHVQAVVDASCFQWVVTFEAPNTTRAAVLLETIPLPPSRQTPPPGIVCSTAMSAARFRLSPPG
jgi:hypothetical protein